MAEEPESALIERAQRGDVAAFEALVRRYQELAFRVAYLITGSAADAEEAAQDGFVRAYRALDRFRPGAPLRPWLLRIVGNAARNRRTAAARRPALALDEVAEGRLADPAASPESTALAAEARRELAAAIDALRPDDRDVIVCRYVLDLSEAETAEALGCARGTVKSRTSRALRRLRDRLAMPPMVEGAGSADGRGDA